MTARPARAVPGESAIAALLDVSDVTVRFGGVVALDGLSFTIDEGQICALIGPNGAGKTTLFNVVSRVYDPSEGTVTYDGKDLVHLAPHTIARVGIARTFQNLALWPGMSVLQNVMVGMHTTSKQSFLTASLRLGLKKEERQLREKAHAALEELDLQRYSSHPAAGLPFGTLKRVELARAIVSDPRLLLLDEPAGGLTHSEVDELAGVIKQIRDSRNLTVLLVEHHMQMVMGISDKVVVLDFGSKIAEGLPSEVQRDERVIEAYLGGAGMTDAATTDGSVPATTGKPILQIQGVHAAYGMVRVLHGIDLEVRDGEVVVVLGANGAGKTTTMRAICGMVDTTGSIRLDGAEIVGKRSADVARMGVAHVPQGRGTFADLSVEENLQVGAFVRKDKEVRSDIERWYDVFPVLGDRRQQQAGTLSGGEQQMLAVARALMGRPRLLLLDEPSLGLAPMIVQNVFRNLQSIREEFGTTMLVVEQNANLALGIADRGYVIEAGRIVLSGTADELGSDDAVRAAYLGY